MGKQLLLLALLLPALTGCGTWANHDKGGSKIYGGTCNDLDVLYRGLAENPNDLFWFPFFLVDLPLSLAGDTVCLPYDVATTISQPH